MLGLSFFWYLWVFSALLSVCFQALFLWGYFTCIDRCFTVKKKEKEHYPGVLQHQVLHSCNWIVAIMILQPQIPVVMQSILSPGSPIWGLWQRSHCTFSKKPIYCSAGARVLNWTCFQVKKDPNNSSLQHLSSLFHLHYNLGIQIHNITYSTYLNIILFIIRDPN